MTAIHSQNAETWSQPAAACQTDPGPRDAMPSVEISPALRPWRITFRDLWARREIVAYLAWRDVQARYHQTTLGALWALLQPLAATLVYAVVFGRLVKIQSGPVPYPLFVMTGILSWQFMALSIQRSSGSLIANGSVIRKVYFPRLAIPLAAVVASLIEFAAASTILFGMMIKYGFLPSYNLALLPFMVLLAAAMGLGIGLMLASINCWFRDVMHGTGFALQMWMFLTPVLYPLSLVPSRYQGYIRCNPMTGMISGFRSVFLGVAPDWTALAISALWTVLFLVVGGALFRRTERALADVL